MMIAAIIIVMFTIITVIDITFAIVTITVTAFPSRLLDGLRAAFRGLRRVEAHGHKMKAERNVKS